MQESTCCIHDCPRPLLAKFLCSKHYDRLRKTGSTRLHRPPRKPCRMPGCTNLRDGLGWCVRHRRRIKENGSPFDHRQKFVIRPERGDCDVCGKRVAEDAGYRRYCSEKCASASGTYRDRPKSRECAQCGSVIDLFARLPSGRIIPKSRTLCDSCAERPAVIQHAPRLVERDGLDCGLCGKPVDMSLAYPDPMSRSVDHILPRSLGGSDHLSNLQLSHLTCNVRKGNRIGGALLRT